MNSPDALALGGTDARSDAPARTRADRARAPASAARCGSPIDGPMLRACCSPTASMASSTARPPRLNSSRSTRKRGSTLSASGMPSANSSRVRAIRFLHQRDVARVEPPRLDVVVGEAVRARAARAECRCGPFRDRATRPARNSRAAAPCRWRRKAAGAPRRGSRTDTAPAGPRDSRNSGSSRARRPRIA